MNRSLLVALCTYLGLLSNPALSQPQPVDGTSGSRPAQVCLARALRDVPQISRVRQGQPLNVVASERAAKSLEEKGFVRTECASARLSAGGEAEAWRNEVCALAAFGNIAVQNQLEAAMGERPAVLCAMAEEIAGPWQGEGKITIVKESDTEG